MRATGDQDELGRGRRIRGEAASLVVDEQAAVEAFAQLHPAAGVRAAVRATRDLDEARPEPDGVVARDATGVAAAEAIGEIARGAAPRGVGRGRRAREAGIVVAEVGREIRFGGLDGVEAAEPELGDEAVLQGFPEAFDAALGLRGVRGNIPDAELPEHLAKVGRMLRALEFFLEAPVFVIADEDAEAVAIEAHRQAVALGEAAEEDEIAMQILRGPEVERKDRPPWHRRWRQAGAGAGRCRANRTRCRR